MYIKNLYYTHMYHHNKILIHKASEICFCCISVFVIEDITIY